MSFSGNVGKLMIENDSGLSEIIKHAFGGIDQMISGKKFYQNVRSCRMLIEELLRRHTSDVTNNLVWGYFCMASPLADGQNVKVERLFVESFYI